MSSAAPSLALRGRRRGQHPSAAQRPAQQLPETTQTVQAADAPQQPLRPPPLPQRQQQLPPPVAQPFAPPAEALVHTSGGSSFPSATPPSAHAGAGGRRSDDGASAAAASPPAGRSILHEVLAFMDQQPQPPTPSPAESQLPQRSAAAVLVDDRSAFGPTFPALTSAPPQPARSVLSPSFSPFPLHRAPARLRTSSVQRPSPAVSASSAERSLDVSAAHRSRLPSCPHRAPSGLRRRPRSHRSSSAALRSPAAAAVFLVTHRTPPRVRTLRSAAASAAAAAPCTTAALLRSSPTTRAASASVGWMDEAKGLRR